MNNICEICKDTLQPPSKLFRNRENKVCCESCYMDTTAMEFHIKLLHGCEVWRFQNSKMVKG